MVRRLVEHQKIHSARLQQRQPGPRALAGGERADDGAHLVGLQSELRQQRPHAGLREVRNRRLERITERQVLRQLAACLVDLPDRHVRSEGGGAGVRLLVAQQ